MSNEISDGFHQKERQFIELMIQVSDKMFELLLGSITNSTELIMSGSLGYLNAEESETMQRFIELYKDQFSTIIPKAETVNDDVDSIIDQLQEKMEAGEEVDFEESEAQEEHRLGLAGLQKQLEVIARLDQGLKDKIGPLMLELQCTDILAQKVEHLIAALKNFSEFTGENSFLSDKEVDATDFLNQLLLSLTMFDERQIFHKIFLNEEITEDDEQTEIQDDISFF